MDEGADVEEVHGTVELVVGAEDGGESPEGVVLDEADVAFLRHHEIVVTTEIVKACLESEGTTGLPFGQDAGHPCFDSLAVFVVPGLAVVGGFEVPVWQCIFSVGTIELLPFDMVVVAGQSRLHTDIHCQQRQTKGCGVKVVVVPCGLHGLVGEGTAGVVAGAVGHVFLVLVVGKDKVRFVSAAFKAQLKGVVGGAVHGPVVRPYDTFVVVGERLSSCLQEEAVACEEFCPCLIYVKGCTSSLSPDAGLAEVYFGGEIGLLKAQNETGASQHKVGVVTESCLGLDSRESAITDFPTGHEL